MTFDWSDPLLLSEQLNEEEVLIRDKAHSYAEEKLAPRITDAYLAEYTDRQVFQELGSLGLLGITLPSECGGSSASYVAFGLVARELERIDSAYRTMMSIQSSLVMYPIYAYGSEECQRRHLSRLGAGEAVGCFAFTEPTAGSDPSDMRTRAVKTAAGYRLNGVKTWISSAPIADVFVIWAKSDAHDGVIRGFILETGMQGLSTSKIEGKLSLRALVTGEVMLQDVEVPESALLNVAGLKGPMDCLNRARYGIAWGVMGAAEDC
jgi:glutaryl-CoA dehydrogenase